MWRIFFACLLVVTISHAASVHDKSQPLKPSFFEKGASVVVGPAINKASLDKREYRQITLPNGLNAVLVSDMEATSAAAAMNVGNGHFSDPDDIPGLAHFLEHMLFLGTEKYPDEDDYSEYIDNHGGYDNAYTAEENTDFFFEILPEHLEGALDKFAQFFIAPLLSESATGREINAVNAEHTKNLQSDPWRESQLDNFLANDDHPFHKFGTGNTDTLEKYDSHTVSQRLRQFYNKHYHAKNLDLCILGKESLDTLQNWTITYFSDVRQKDPADADGTLTFPEELFSSDVLGHEVRFRSIKDTRTLSLKWPLPSQEKTYKKKSAEFIGSLITNLLSSGLYQRLNDLGWISDIYADFESDASAFSLFEVQFDLEEDGVEHYNDIITAFFSYVSVIKEQGVEEWRYNEKVKTREAAWNLKSKEGSSDYVSSIASNMMTYATEDLLTADYLYKEFDADHINSILASLTPDNMYVMLSTQDLEDEFDQMEPWYQIPFVVKEIPEELMNKWSEGEGLVNLAQLGLPERNWWIPDDTSIKPYMKVGQENVPDIILEKYEPFAARLWHKQDKKFQQPHVHMSTRFWTPLVHESPRSVVLSQMWQTMLGEHLLDSLTYMASQAGFNMNLNVENNAWLLDIRGYADGMSNFTQHVCDSLKFEDFTQNEFDMAKADLLKNYANAAYAPPHKHAMYLKTLFISPTRFDTIQVEEALNSITIEDVVAWRSVLFSDVSMEALIHGNIDADEALDLYQILLDNIDATTVSNTFTPDERNVKFSTDQTVRISGNYTLTSEVPNVKDQNSVVYSLYQYGRGGDDEALLSNILSFIASRPCYNTLRTQEQLGYIVWSGVDSRSDVYDFYIVVQSGVYSADFVRARVNVFVEETLQPIIQNLPEEEYAKHVQTLRDQLSNPDTRISTVTARFWKEISLQRYDFERKQRMLDIIDSGKLTQAKFTAYANEILGYNDNTVELLTIRLNSARYNSGADVAAAPAPAPAPAPACADDVVHLMNKDVTVLHSNGDISLANNNSSAEGKTQIINVQGLHALSLSQPMFPIVPNGKLPMVTPA